MSRPHAGVLDPREILVRLPGLAALAMSISLALHLLTLKLVGYDLAAYILGARRLLAGEALYQTDLAGLGPFGQFLYPPPVAFLFIPLAIIPFDAARLIGLAALVGVSVLLVRRLAGPLPASVRYWAASAIVLFFPLIWEVSLENLTLVTLALCLVAWDLRLSPRWSGVALAAGLGLKLLPLTLIAYFVASRRGRVAIWAVAALALLVGLSWPFIGALWLDYARVLVTIATIAPGTGSNIVPVAFSSPALRFVLPAVGVAVALICGAASRRGIAAEDHGFRVTLAAVPLAASTVWYPYLVFALPLLIADPPRARRRALRVSFLAVRPVAWYLMQRQFISEPGRDFLLPLVGLLVLIAVGLLEVRSALDADIDRPARSRNTTMAIGAAEHGVVTPT